MGGYQGGMATSDQFVRQTTLDQDNPDNYYVFPEFAASSRPDTGPAIDSHQRSSAFNVRGLMSIPALSPEEVRRALDQLPRLRLAHLPTPLDEVPRFAARLGVGRILIKRDDCSGVLFGGNKTRHNEFLLADALRRDCDVVVWGAGIQSNNCRQTAAACAKLGLECRLFLSRTTHNDDLQGNLLLATSEGILLDPVYTAKAMAGLIHDARAGRLDRNDTVVFLHTGGLPAVFAYRDDLLPHLRLGREGRAPKVEQE